MIKEFYYYLEAILDSFSVLKALLPQKYFKNLSQNPIERRENANIMWKLERFNSTDEK